MTFGSFKFLPKTSLGVDIGTSSLKVVELSRWGTRKSLKNYGEIRSQSLYDAPFRTGEKNSLLLLSQDIARALRAILTEANIRTKKTVFSIPDFSSFFTHFELPQMSKEELPQAVQYEARKHIPLPFSEITFDWQVIKEMPSSNKERKIRILMVAVPNELINQYQEIAKLAGLELVALEAEVFGFIRSCLKEEKGPIALLDIGAQTTTINLAYNGFLISSHSIDTAGNSFTQRIAQSLSIDVIKAQEQKKTQGLNSPDNLRLLSPLIDIIVTELQKSCEYFKVQGKREVEKIILGGGAALMPGLKEYFERSIQKEIVIADPFRHVFYSPILEATMKEMGPSYAVAVGMAQRGLE